MVRISPEEFIKRLSSATEKARIEATEGILLDVRIEKFSKEKLKITFIDLRRNVVKRVIGDSTWEDIITKSFSETLLNGKLPLVRIFHDMNRMERIEFKGSVEISKVIEIIDAIAERDNKYIYVDVHGKFLDQDTVCAVKSGSGIVYVPPNLLSVMTLKDSLHGKVIEGYVIGHESASKGGITFDAFILRSVVEAEEPEEVEDDSTVAEGGREERIELPEDIQRKISDLLSQVKD